MATKKKEDATTDAMANSKELDNKKFVTDRLLATGRVGIKGLIQYMEDI